MGWVTARSSASLPWLVATALTGSSMSLRFSPYSSETYRQPLTVRHLLDANELSAAAQEIVYREHVRMTYKDLRERIGRCASALRSLGVREGTTVAMLDWDSHRYLEALFAVPMMGAVLQTVNIRLSPAQIQYTIDHAGAEILLIHRDFLPLIDGMRSALPKARSIVALADGSEDPLPAWAAAEYESMLSSATASYPFADFDEDTMATTFYTTGTTGAPKAVCFSHRQLVLHTLAVAAALGAAVGPGLRLDDVYMPLTPMFHVHAWGIPYVATMLGVKQVYPGRYEPDLIVRLREREGVTFSHCVPTVLQMVIDAAARSNKILRGWHMLIGGSALSRELYAMATARNLTVAAGYGMSETGPVIAIARRGEEPYADIRSGTPIPLVCARPVDSEMEPLPGDDSSLGELVLRAPWLTTCYPGDPVASDALWRGGWLHTQDLATINGAGSIQIRDRLKDVIKSGGEWICSLTLESLIISRADVAEVAVVGVPHPQWQERPVAVVVPAAGERPTTEAVNHTLAQAAAAGIISRVALIEKVICVDVLPRTSVGKIDKKAIRAMLAGSRAADP